MWADSDPSLAVKCHDFVSDTNGNALFESKKLRPRPKLFEAERPRSRGQDCQWSAWGGWSECSKSCDLGRQEQCGHELVNFDQILILLQIVILGRSRKYFDLF